jgi:hypothetical protein
VETLNCMKDYSVPVRGAAPQTSPRMIHVQTDAA